MQRQKQAFAEHLLNNMTWPERILWSRLRHRQLGYSFQRQAIVLGFIVDFWCAEARVAIEVDGSVHQQPFTRERDERKDEVFYRHGIKCLRFSNWEISNGMSAVLIRAWDECFAAAPHPLRPVLRANPNLRHERKVEMQALRTFQEQKRLELHAVNFGQNYWKNRRISVHYVQEAIDGLAIKKDMNRAVGLPPKRRKA